MKTRSFDVLTGVKLGDSPSQSLLNMAIKAAKQYLRNKILTIEIWENISG